MFPTPPTKSNRSRNDDVTPSTPSAIPEASPRDKTPKAVASEEVQAIKLAHSLQTLKIGELEQQLNHRIKLGDAQKIMFQEKLRASDALLQSQKEQISELIHTNESLNTKLASVQLDFSTNLDTATSRILELESVLSIAKIEADKRLRETTHISALVIAEQARFKDLLAEFCSKAIEELPQKQSFYQTSLSALTTSRNKLEGNIFDLLRLNESSSLLSQETEDLFNTINNLNNTIKILKNKSRSKTKKLTDQINSTEEMLKSVKAELSQAMYKLASSQAEQTNMSQALEDAEAESKRMHAELQSVQTALLNTRQQLEDAQRQRDSLERNQSHLKSENASAVQHLQITLQELEERLKRQEESNEEAARRWKQREDECESSLTKLRKQKEDWEEKAKSLDVALSEERKQAASQRASSEEALAALQSKCEDYLQQVSEEKEVQEELSKRYEDVSSRLSAGIQELKAMQRRLLSCQQEKEEVELRLKDSDLRCNMLVADNEELRRQKEESETSLQSQVKRCTAELEAVNASLKSKALSLKSMTFKVSELEKAIADHRAEATLRSQSHERTVQSLKAELSERQFALANAEAEQNSLRQLLQDAEAESKRLHAELRAVHTELLNTKQELEEQMHQQDSSDSAHAAAVQNCQIALQELEERLKRQEESNEEAARRWKQREDECESSLTKLRKQKEDWEEKAKSLDMSLSEERKQAASQRASSEEALAALQSKCEDYLQQVSEEKEVQEELSKRYEDVSSRLSAGIQELKAMQRRLLSCQQEKEEVELRLKDSDLRCNMLVADNEELRRQKEESETSLQSQVKRLVNEVESMKASHATLSSRHQTISIEKGELEQAIQSLQERLERREKETTTTQQQLHAQSDEWRTWLTKLTWKSSSLCDHIEMATSVIRNGPAGSSLTSPRATVSARLSPRDINTTNADVSQDLDKLMSRLEGMAAMVDDLCHGYARACAEANRRGEDLHHAEEDITNLTNQITQCKEITYKDRKELEALKIIVEDQKRKMDKAKEDYERSQASQSEAAHQLESLHRDLERAEGIVLKQKQALEGANEVMKRQRYELDEVNQTLLGKKRDLDQASQLIKQQEAALDDASEMVEQLRGEKSRLEGELVEYQEALTMMMSRFQDEFGTLQNQLADLQSFSSL